MTDDFKDLGYFFERAMQEEDKDFLNDLLVTELELFKSVMKQSNVPDIKSHYLQKLQSMI